jgi:hypothetical protein
VTDLPRNRRPGLRVDRVTDAVRAIESVPDGARYRVSWTVTGYRRKVTWLFSDFGARRFCERRGIEFPAEPSAPRSMVPAPMSCAHDPFYASHAGEPIPDYKARAAGEE